MTKENNVSIPAFLMVSKYHVGVTDSLADITAYSNEHLQPGDTLILQKGYFDELLVEQQKILTLDNLRNCDGKSLIVPHKQTDFNLIERNPDARQLITVVDILK